MSIIGKAVCGVVGSAYDVAGGKFPRTVRIETTNRCNARCTICPHGRMTRATGVMDEALYRSVIAECVRGGCRTIHLHNFGEPLLDPDLPERIACAKKAGLARVKIFTNGSLLAGDLAARLLDSGLDEIKVSIDGADREEFSAIRVGLDYDKVIANVREFVAMRNRKGQARPKVIATCVSTSDRTETESQLRGVVDYYEFVRIHNWGDQGTAGRRRVRKPCSRAWGTFTILWNGDAVPCCLDFDGKVVLGNLKADGSIAAIWQSKAYKDFRASHRRGEQAHIGICQACAKSFL